MQYQLFASGILAAWEAGAPRHPLDRSLAILWAANAAEDPADWTLWERDRRLLKLREETFGTWLPAQATCPACEAELEMDLDVGALAEHLRPADSSSAALLPLTSRDLAAAAAVAPEARATVLRERLHADGTAADTEGDGTRAGVGDALLDARIEAAARASELTTQLTCPDCGHIWSEVLDVTDHVWADVESAALGLLHDVARLADRFGWAEADILAMSPARRRAYLSMVMVHE